MYGDPFTAAPYWRQQHSSDCGEMAVADVVGQITGHEPAEQQITDLAKSTPSTAGTGSIWNLPADTDIRDLPVLLAHYGIEADNIQTSINALEQYLAKSAGSSSYSTPKPSGIGLANATPRTTSSLSPAWSPEPVWCTSTTAASQTAATNGFRSPPSSGPGPLIATRQL